MSVEDFLDRVPDIARLLPEIADRVQVVRREVVDPHLAEYSPAFAADRLSEDTLTLLTDHFGVPEERALSVLRLVPADLADDFRCDRIADLYALFWVYRLNGLEQAVRGALTDQP